MKKQFIFLVSIFLLSCNQNSSKKITNDFVEFDEINHFTTTESYISNPLNIRDSILNSIIVNDTPLNVPDSTFEKKLNIGGYDKKAIKSENYSEIKEVEINAKESNEATACEPFYRDILIYKKSGRIKAISKICFECRKDYNVGFPENIRKNNNLQLYPDYSKMKSLIN